MSQPGCKGMIRTMRRINKVNKTQWGRSAATSQQNSEKLWRLCQVKTNSPSPPMPGCCKENKTIVIFFVHLQRIGARTTRHLELIRVLNVQRVPHLQNRCRTVQSAVLEKKWGFSKCVAEIGSHFLLTLKMYILCTTTGSSYPNVLVMFWNLPKEKSIVPR